MGAALVVYIETAADEILAMKRIRGRAPAMPGRHVITDPAERGLLERTDDLRTLAFRSGAVARKPQAEIDSQERAELIASDAAFFDQQRRTAVLEAMLDIIPGSTTLADLEAAYVLKLNR